MTAFVIRAACVAPRRRMIPSGSTLPGCKTQDLARYVFHLRPEGCLVLAYRNADFDLWKLAWSLSALSPNRDTHQSVVNATQAQGRSALPQTSLNPPCGTRLGTLGFSNPFDCWQQLQEDTKTGSRTMPGSHGSKPGDVRTSAACKRTLTVVIALLGLL